ncbi:MAG: hypothetical protein M1816_002612 [Peltula sp. TS41687]|nr:MAG: hypothetical protein M1816_002612 [Peltula sp. TS41687]
MDFGLPEIEPMTTSELEEFFREEALTHGSLSSEGEAPVTNHPEARTTVTTERMNFVTPRGTSLQGGIIRTRTHTPATRGQSQNHGVSDWSREVGVGGSGSASRGRGYDSPG